MTKMNRRSLAKLSNRLSLQKKFFLATATILMIFTLLVSVFVYVSLKHFLLEYSYEKTRLLMAEAEAARKYVKDILRPKMYAILPKDSFVVEAMSTSYVTRKVMGKVAYISKDMMYKRAAMDPHNPSNKADEFERKMILEYNKTHSRREWQGIIQRNGRNWFVTIEPIYTEKTCLRCHGSPSNAPLELTQRYGTSSGFHRKEGEVAGLDVVAIPVDNALSQIHRVALVIIGTGILTVITLFVFVGLFFEKLVHRPLKSLNSFCESVEKGTWKTDEPMRMCADDEIGRVAVSFERLVRHLQDTQRKLQKYSENLETLVDLRTKELNQNRKFLETLVATSPIGFLVINGQGEVIFWNDAAQQITGIPARKVLRHYIDNLDFLHPLIIDVPKNINKTESHSSKESTFVQPGGSTIHLLVNQATISGENPDAFMTIINFTDISEIKRLHEELDRYASELEIIIDEKVALLRESELRYRELFQHANDAILFLSDRDFKIIDVNPRWLKLSGYKKEEIIGEPLYDFLEAKDNQCALKCLERSYKKPCTLKLKSKKNNRIYIELISSSFAMNNKSYIMSIVRDITARKQLEEAILHTNIELKKRNKALQDMTIKLSKVEEKTRRKFSTILHDQIGQDLAAIKINIGMLKKQMEKENIKLFKELARMQELLDKVIATTRDLTLEMYPTILDNLGLVAALRWYADYFSEKFAMQVSVRERGTINRLPLDVENLLFRLVQEALVNCAKHSGAKEAILSVWGTDAKITITVADDGKGFDLKKLNSTSLHSGVGLHIIRERMNYLGGSIEILSNPGAGTIVIFQLPLQCLTDKKAASGIDDLPNYYG